VFGRRGARTLNKEEMQRLYLRDGKTYAVEDEKGKESAER